MQPKNTDKSTIGRTFSAIIKESQRTRAVLVARPVYADPDIVKLVDLMGEAEKLAYLLMGRQIRGELDDLMGDSD